MHGDIICLTSGKEFDSTIPSSYDILLSCLIPCSPHVHFYTTHLSNILSSAKYSSVFLCSILLCYFLICCLPKGKILHCLCSRHEGSGPAGLPKSVEEVWRREWIVIFMWCIYVWTLYMRCSIDILFTCVLVLSRPVVKGGCACETRILGKNSKLLGGPRQTRKIHVVENWQKLQSNLRTRPWRTYLWGAPRKWPLKYVQSIW